ncbi:MAG: hypothetical protein CMM16_03420 [Rhodospirillaceae bacterium]|nr:hypothetical protein [Rhodospirillaceae bacterium]|tara:strand:+ start:18 stop:719 length:702 start_codon:yes stop_codon:yes gene_type:complete
MTSKNTIVGTAAARLQSLYVHLLFCDKTYERYVENPEELAKAYRIDNDALSALPEAAAPQLLAERHGRRAGVLIEVKRVFGQSYSMIEALPEFTFSNFLSSKAFFDDASGLPHPYGVGPGYENASKFYFWARENLRLAGESRRLHLHSMMNGDFAANLIDQYSKGAEPYYRRFSRGIYWRETNDAALPVIFMTPERHVFRIADAGKLEQVLSAGAIDLDDLTPEIPSHGTNIL